MLNKNNVLFNFLNNQQLSSTNVGRGYSKLPYALKIFISVKMKKTLIIPYSLTQNHSLCLRRYSFVFMQIYDAYHEKALNQSTGVQGELVSHTHFCSYGSDDNSDGVCNRTAVRTHTPRYFVFSCFQQTN